jgi:hypothetical protein
MGRLTYGGELIAEIAVERLEPVGQCHRGVAPPSVVTLPLYTFIMSGDSTKEW